MHGARATASDEQRAARVDDDRAAATTVANMLQRARARGCGRELARLSGGGGRRVAVENAELLCGGVRRADCLLILGERQIVGVGALGDERRVVGALTLPNEMLSGGELLERRLAAHLVLQTASVAMLRAANGLIAYRSGRKRAIIRTLRREFARYVCRCGCRLEVE